MITVLAMGWINRNVESLHKTLAKRLVKVRSLDRTLRCYLGPGDTMNVIVLSPAFISGAIVVNFAVILCFLSFFYLLK